MPPFFHGQNQDDAFEIYNLCNKETQKHIKIDLIPGNLREFLAITKHCNALIGNEGGAVNMAKALDIPTFTIFSPWINKNDWNCFEDGKNNISVHEVLDSLNKFQDLANKDK